MASKDAFLVTTFFLAKIVQKCKVFFPGFKLMIARSSSRLSPPLIFYEAEQFDCIKLHLFRTSKGECSSLSPLDSTHASYLLKHMTSVFCESYLHRAVPVDGESRNCGHRSTKGTLKYNLTPLRERERERGGGGCTYSVVRKSLPKDIMAKQLYQTDDELKVAVTAAFETITHTMLRNMSHRT